jgi:hypothetical protein
VAFLRSLIRRLGVALALLAIVGRLLNAWRVRREAEAGDRRRRRDVLPSLYELHPGATLAPRRRLGLRAVPLERIVGTTRNPSQNTGDFLPLPQLRGRNWRSRWQRISRATNQLATLPPVDLVKVGDDYFVEDGHNRIAAAQQLGALETDADVIELMLPGTAPAPPEAPTVTTALVDTDDLRRASTGSFSRTAGLRRSGPDSITRQQLADAPHTPDGEPSPTEGDAPEPAEDDPPA